MRQEQAELNLEGSFVRAVLSQSGFPHFALLFRTPAVTVAGVRLLTDRVRFHSGVIYRLYRLLSLGICRSGISSGNRGGGNLRGKTSRIRRGGGASSTEDIGIGSHSLGA